MVVTSIYFLKACYSSEKSLQKILYSKDRYREQGCRIV